MNNSLVYYFILIIVTCISCQFTENKLAKNDTERTCECPMEDLPDEETSIDSIAIKNLENDLFDWSIGGKISGKFKKIIDAEIDANISSTDDNYSISTKKVIAKMNNNYPQLIDKAYSFKLGKVFYCTYYAILCQDTTISDSQLRIKSLEKLEEFKQETKDIEKIKKQSKPKHTSSRTSKTKVKTKDASIIVENQPSNINFGDNSVVGNNINSTITLNPRERLNENEKKMLIKDLNLAFRAAKRYNTECVQVIAVGNHPKAIELRGEIEPFLKEKGYNIRPYRGLYLVPPRNQKIDFKAETGICMGILISFKD